MLDPVVLATAGRLGLQGGTGVAATALRLALAVATILIAAFVATPAEPLRQEAAIAVDRSADLPRSKRVEPRKKPSIDQGEQSMAYVDGFVVAVPNANKDAYREVAERAAKVFRENGALEVIEAWGDDVPDGKVTSFPMAVKKQDDETVVFSWIRWESKAARDEGMGKAFKVFEAEKMEMPFDGQRMIYGGFDVIVER